MHARREVTLPYPNISPSSLSSSSHSGSGCSLMSESYAAHLSTGKNPTNRYHCRVISIDMLPGDVLIEIFDFYVGVDLLTQKGILVDAWRTLVHVCRRWRSLVFGSPRRLKLRLVCTHRTPTRKTLDVWPALPLIIHGHASKFVMDNLIAALERRDRVCKIDFRYYIGPESGKFLAAMREPFPELTHLRLEARVKARSRFGDEDSGWSKDPELLDDLELLLRPGEQDIPDSFLGGSAPCLQFLRMNAVRLEGLQKLLLSATHLIDLHLFDIPDYISSQWTATCLSKLTNLQTLSLAFQPHHHPPNQENRHPSPPTRIVLPALRFFRFTGVGKYLENLMALIDTPELNQLSIALDQHVSNTPELAQFVSRMPKSGVPDEARVIFHDFGVTVRVKLPSQAFDHELLNVGISSGNFHDIPTSEELDSQFSCLAQICASLSPTISTVETLYIYKDSFSTLSWDEDMESTGWLELLRSFIALKNLYLSNEFAPRIASALEDLDEDSNTELLLSLQNILVRGLQPSGHIQEFEGIRQFIVARRLIGHRIAVSTWDIKYDETW